MLLSILQKIFTSKSLQRFFFLPCILNVDILVCLCIANASPFDMKQWRCHRTKHTAVIHNEIVEISDKARTHTIQPK